MKCARSSLMGSFHLTLPQLLFPLHMENRNEGGRKSEKKEGSEFVQKLGQRKKRKMIFH